MVLVVCKKKTDYAPVAQIFAVLHADAADVERDSSRAEAKKKLARMAAASMPRTEQLGNGTKFESPTKPPAAVGSVEPLVADTNLKNHTIHKNHNNVSQPPAAVADDEPTAADSRLVRLVVPMIAVCPDGHKIELNVLCDTGSETDLVDVKAALALRRHKVSWGEPGGRLVVIGGGEMEPEGSLRMLLQAATGYSGLPLPRILDFVCEPDIIKDPTADVVLGWSTLLGTGLLECMLHSDQYGAEAGDEATDLDDFWPDLDPETYEMPKISGTPEQQRRLAELCHKYKVLFGPMPFGGSKLPAMDLTLKRDAFGNEIHPKPQKCRPCAPWISELIRLDDQRRIANGFAEYGLSPYSSPVVAAKQPQKGPYERRICADYGFLNECAIEDKYPVKDQRQSTRRLAGSRLFSELDMRKGYNQIRLTEKASQLCAQVGPHGQLLPKTCPFGIHTLPAYFQYLMSQKVLHGIDGDGVESFVDDCNVHAPGETDEEAFEREFELLEECFKRFMYWDLRLNGAKTHLNKKDCIYLGKGCDGEGHRHTDKRVAAVAEIVRPYDRKQLKSFIGLINFFRDYCGMDFAEVTRPLTEMTGKHVPFTWNDGCQAAFDEVKTRIVQRQKLYFLDYDRPIYLRCDASKIGCGAMLFQVVEPGVERPVAFASKAFSETETRWSVLEQELFAAFWAMKRWSWMLLGHPFTVLTDHRNILQLSKSVVPKIVRWRLQMQEFHYTIQHVPGASERHAVVDCISRLHGPARGVRVVSAAAVKRAPPAQGAAFEPDPDVLDVVHGYHNGTVGHLGVKATNELIVKDFKAGALPTAPSNLLKNLRRHVQYVRENCPLCQKLQKKKTAAEPPLHSISVNKMFKELSIDVIGPLPETANGCKFIIAVVDGFSRYLFAKPIRATTAVEAARYVHELAGMFGYPDAFRWDNCSQFDNHLLKCLTDLVGVERHPSVAYNPQSNGLIERAIAEIITHLKYIVNDRRMHEEWDMALPIALRIINGKKHASIGLSPAELMLPGRDINAHMYPTKQPDVVSDYIQNSISDKKVRDVTQLYLSNLIALQAQAIKSAQEFQELVVRRRVVDNAPEKFRQFSAGDWVVWKWRGGKPAKLYVDWRGPYRVLSRLSSTTYLLEDPADLKQYKRHVRELFPYKMGLTADPADVIAMDEAEFLVDFIADHDRPDPKRKSTWRFRVRWAGCGEEEDTWLAYKDVNPLAAFDTYIKEHPELGLK